MKFSFHPLFIKLFHWEYWSFNVIYIPIYPAWIWLCLRARSFFFFAASNPGIKNGGFLGESKKEIAGIIPEELHPRTAFFPTHTDPEHVLKEIRRLGFHFPLIGKPDIGGRGRGVHQLQNEEEVTQYVQMADLDFHIQEFVKYEKEAGIFYYRFPGQQKGNLSGIVRKEFLQVCGNGRDSVESLLVQNKRAVLQLQSLRKKYGEELSTVLPAGAIKVLVHYGNHARGALFIDDSRLIDEELTETIDSICQKLDGFYFGRLDIRFQSWEDLKKGRNFIIIEVNGAGSEPTHIYDPGHSLFFAWKEIIRHWSLLWRISRINHQLGYPYLTFKAGWQMFAEDIRDSEKLKKMA
jgi:hypothetical protein